MERDREADLLALAAAFVIVPLAFAIVGGFLWPMFNSAGDSVHQVYKISEILTGFIGFGILGEIVGGILMFVRSKTETPAELSNHH